MRWTLLVVLVGCSSQVERADASVSRADITWHATEERPTCIGGALACDEGMAGCMVDDVQWTARCRAGVPRCDVGRIVCAR